MLAPVLVTKPSALPVSVDEARARLRVDGGDEDDTIEALLEAATDHLDGYTGILGRAIVEQTWRQDFAGFAACLRLPFGPVTEKPTVEYFDGDNVKQTLSSAVFQIATDSRGPFVGLAPGQSWPSSYDRDDAVAVTFKAGSAVTDVPAALKQAVLLLAGHWFQNREAVAASGVDVLPIGVDRLIAAYRRPAF